MKLQKITAKPQHGLLDTKQCASFFFLDKSSISPFSNTEIVLCLLQLMYRQRIDINNVLQKSDVESSTGIQDQKQRDSPSESKRNEPITSNADRCLFHMQFVMQCLTFLVNSQTTRLKKSKSFKQP